MNWVLTASLIFAIATQCSSNSLMRSSQLNTEIQKSKGCTYLKTHGMFGVDCNDLHLFTVPTKLSTSIEVLDVTYNRIRELHNTSFENYPYLRILYLTDNIISYIEAGAFEPIPDLEILDLTLNSLHSVPEALDVLTSLKKLMMGNNPLGEVTFSKTLPSVQYLSLSSCKLKTFPDLNSLPGLVQLNFSGNRLQALETTQVAPLCSLKLLDLRENHRLFRQEHCKCQIIAKWFTDLAGEGFELLPKIDSLCKDTTEGKQFINDPEVCFTNETNLILEKSKIIRKSCEVEVMKYASAALRLKASARWVLIVLVSLAIIFVCAFCLYYVRKRQVALRNRSPTSVGCLGPSKTSS